MKTKLTSVTYLGYTAMDRRFSTAMLPWLLREVTANKKRDKLSVTIEDGYLKAFNGNFEPVIVHRLVDIIRASQVPGRPEELFYILFNEKEGLLNCFLFRASTALEACGSVAHPGMFADARVDDFYAIIRNRTASMMSRVRDSANSMLAVVADHFNFNFGIRAHWVSKHQPVAQLVAQ